MKKGIQFNISPKMIIGVLILIVLIVGFYSIRSANISILGETISNVELPECKNGEYLGVNFLGGWDCLTPPTRDDLGNHLATQDLDLHGNNFVLGNGWITNDGDNEGIKIDDKGNIVIGTPKSILDYRVNIDGKVVATFFNSLGGIQSNGSIISSGSIVGESISAENTISGKIKPVAEEWSLGTICSSKEEGQFRYRSHGINKPYSYLDICMRTGYDKYYWKTICSGINGETC